MLIKILQHNKNCFHYGRVKNPQVFQHFDLDETAANLPGANTDKLFIAHGNKEIIAKSAPWLSICVAAGVLGLVTTTAASAFDFGDAVHDLGSSAQDLWDKGGHSADQESRRMGGSVDRAVGLTTFNLNITNRTGGPINYALNGRLDQVSPNNWKSWRGTSQGRPIINFDNGAGQQVRYGLDPGQNYSFQWRSRVLQLTRD